MRSHPWRSGVWMAVMLLAMAALWATFAPQRAGGQSTYVIVAGASMEPVLHWGDLVIARQTQDYQAGDIVAYEHPDVGPVIHRILSTEDGRFTLKGDANGWTDSYEPSAEEILGEAWIRVPAAGNLLVQMRQPAALSLLALGVSLLVVSMVVPMKKSSRSSPPRGAAWVAGEAATLQTIVFVLGLISLLALALGVPAWTRPLEKPGTRSLDYVHQGTFDYKARVTAGVYDTGQLQTGDPVYLRLNRSLSVTFDYRFASDAVPVVRGTTALRAEIRDVNGWHRALVLQPAQAFEGTKASAFGLLDLNVVERTIRDLESLTGVERPTYTLVIVPEVTVIGELGGQPIETAFAPTLEFQLDALQLQLIREDPTAPGADPVHPAQGGTLEVQVSEANQVNLLGAKVGVRPARWISAIGLLVGLGGLAAMTWLVSRVQRSDPDASASLKYGAQIVDVKSGAFTSQWPALEMGSLDDLARVAARAGSVIHRVRGDSGSEYFVQDQGRLYRLASTPDSGSGEAGKVA